MAKIIMHIDLNAFFATAETIKDPSLEGKPLIIAGSSRRGIVSTASYEARKFGIHSAMPTYMAQRLCPSVIIRNVDFELYHRLSQEFFAFVREYTNIIEIASVDECYADMSECMKDCKDPQKFLEDLRDNLYKKTKLKCSIGLAPNKFLAKMASDFKKPLGVTIIRKKDIPSFKPYYVVFNNVKIGFGKNSTQNDYLTFKEAKKDYYFLHIFKDHGPHVVIFSSTPSNEIKEFASELALYLSSSTVGEVLYTQIKNVKKGDVEGKVNILKYETFNIVKFKYDIASYLLEAKRF